MKQVQRRAWRLDPLLALALVVGLGVVLTTTARAEERPAMGRHALAVSYPGALPALRQRLREQTDGLLRSAQAALPAQGRPTRLSWSLAAPEVEPAMVQLHDPDTFVAEERATMTLVYKHRW
jgi:hypothetical protein